jgi:hypothetical protein
MNNRILSRFFLIAALFILICACAKISAPTGGPRDRFPPVVVKSVPENGTKNFRGKSIIHGFPSNEKKAKGFH